MTDDDQDQVLTDPVRSEAAMTTRQRQAAKQHRAALRRQEILERRIAGMTFTEIAIRMEMSVTGVRKAYRSALSDHYKTAAAEERETALIRCDGIIRRWWPRLLNEDDTIANQATANVMRALNFQADLWGMKHTNVHLDADVPRQMPTTSEVWNALQDLRSQHLAREAGAIDTTAEVTTPQTNGHTAA